MEHPATRRGPSHRHWRDRKAPVHIPLREYRVNASSYGIMTPPFYCYVSTSIDSNIFNGYMNVKDFTSIYTSIESHGISKCKCEIYTYKFYINTLLLVFIFKNNI